MPMVEKLEPLNRLALSDKVQSLVQKQPEMDNHHFLSQVQRQSQERKKNPGHQGMKQENMKGEEGGEPEKESAFEREPLSFEAEKERKLDIRI